jgi:hypothetical protein
LRLRWLCDGTDRLNWGDLVTIVEEAPRSSALLRHLKPAESEWDTNSYLLAAAVDALNGANWQRGGGKGKQPDPVPRPNDGPQRPSIEPAPESNVFGANGFEPDALSLEEIDAWLGRTPADT